LVAYAPLMVFSGILLGVLLHIQIPIIFSESILFQVIGLSLLFIATVLILWAQKHRRLMYKHDTSFMYKFLVGPYLYSRNPTYLGFFLVVVGASLVMNMVWILVVGVIIFLLFNFVLIPKEEKLLMLQYKDIFLNYKKKVRKWI
jgi:protein-S-isoprenylcysteine O-methyltransferase Ste14